jgi:glycine/D-amino acid oxidase-like deaminating enzyme
MRFGLRNARRMIDIVSREKIECDLSTAGWLRIAYSVEEEDALRREVELGKENGLDFAILSPAQIKKRYGLDAKFKGRLARNNGNYHPFKLVNQQLERTLARGVKLYTRTPVTGIESTPGGQLVKTSRGTIRAKTVIAATNAFTSKLFPELAAIEYHQSQIFNLEHVENTLGGITFTDKDGDVYANFPKCGQYVDEHGVARGTMHVGGGRDRPGLDPAKLRRSRHVYDLVLREVVERFPGTAGQPPSRCWTGPMAFTPDRLPALGFLRPGVIVAAGFNGYGGTYCTEAGAIAAEMALTGKTPETAPESMFSPKRFVKAP